jgi:uncharacterized metal-binding protein
MANHIAVKLDRLKVAEMSCIAGVGGEVRPLVRTAKSGRPIIALDGCPLHCAAQILKRHGLQADKHYDLSKMGVKKRPHEDFDPAEAARHLQTIVQDCAMAGYSPGANQSPAAGTTTLPTSGAETTASTAPPDQPNVSVEEAHEPSSPVCYLAEFKDW